MVIITSRHKKYTDNIWWSILLALSVINIILSAGFFMLPKQKKGDIFITKIPLETIKTEDYSAVNTPENSPKQAQGAYVASKNGNIYYPPECAGALKINEKNRIWFQSKEEAEKTGYKLAKSCL